MEFLGTMNCSSTPPPPPNIMEIANARETGGHYVYWWEGAWLTSVCYTWAYNVDTESYWHHKAHDPDSGIKTNGGWKEYYNLLIQGVLFDV